MPFMTIIARKLRTEDCMDAAVRRLEDRTMHGAILENRSVHVVREDLPGWRSSTELPKVGAPRPQPPLWKKCIFSGARYFFCDSESNCFAFSIAPNSGATNTCLLRIFINAAITTRVSKTKGPSQSNKVLLCKRGRYRTKSP
jgi:hypothetical protein